MKSVGIYYFSGTGNTALVANTVKETFVQLGYAVDLVRIEDVLKKNLALDLSQYDFVGIGSQVIGYGAPNLVLDFIHRLPQGHRQKVFIFRTAGGVAPINYNASRSMIRRLTRKGYDVVYERLFSISSNWIVRFEDAVIQQLVAATRRKAALMCREVIQGERRYLKTGLGQQIRMETVAFLSRWFFRLVGQDYRVGPSCSKCGLCVRNCPTSNIYNQNGKIKFKLSCASCLRCVYSCPQQALQFKFLKFFAVEGGYNLKHILGQPALSAEKPSGKVPPFFEEYLANDAL